MSQNELQRTAFCPYCQVILDQLPQRKKKCKACGNYIYIRSSPSNRERILVTEQEAKKIDLEWEQRNERIESLNTLISFGLAESDFERRKAALSKKRQDEASNRDVVWSLMNELALKYIKEQDYQQLSHLYYTMALVLDKAGKEFIDCLKESQKMSLLNLKKSFVKQVSIMTAGEQSCQSCQKLSNIVMTVDEALKMMPLPCKYCTNSVYSDNQGFCRCQYVAEVDLDAFIREHLG